MPQASIAFHVLVIVLVQELPPLTSPPTCCTVAPLQASDAVGGVKVGVVVHSMVALVPAVPIVGACVSLTVMVWLRVVEVLPHASIAFHVLVTVFKHELPVVTSEPTVSTVAPLHASDAVGGVNDGEAVHSTVAFDVAPMTGSVLSIIEIV